MYVSLPSLSLHAIMPNHGTGQTHIQNIPGKMLKSTFNPLGCRVFSIWIHDDPHLFNCRSLSPPLLWIGMWSKIIKFMPRAVWPASAKCFGTGRSFFFFLYGILMLIHTGFQVIFCFSHIKSFAGTPQDVNFESGTTHQKILNFVLQASLSH